MGEKRRRDEELYFSEIIKNNINKMIDYYCKIEQISYGDKYDDYDEISKDLNDYYVRKRVEIINLISYTNLYLTQWKSLKLDDKRTVEDILKKTLWLVYDYYPMNLPLDTRNRRWQSKKITLSEQKEKMLEETEIINKI